MRVFELTQRGILNVSYFACSIFKSRRKISWVVGVEEVASMLISLAASIPRSVSVCLYEHKYYKFDYSISLPVKPGTRLGHLVRLIMGPVILGYLASRIQGVIYVGASGFLLDYGDAREYEFQWLRSRGIRVVCYFTGSDIRSPKLMLDFERKTGLQTLGGRIVELNPSVTSEEFDSKKKQIAQVADTYASLIYNARIDQMSYLRSETKPFRYFYPDSSFKFNPEKFSGNRMPIVVHAPSSPQLKGTELVRQAVAELKNEGLNFEYVELVDVDNDKVLQELERAHIVLNEFYSFVPGVFGVEAMAHTCALITSADEKVETDLPAGSNQAWLQTYPDEIKTNLRRLLNGPKLSKELAIKGFEWATTWATSSSSGRDLYADLNKLVALTNTDD